MDNENKDKKSEQENKGTNATTTANKPQQKKTEEKKPIHPSKLRSKVELSIRRKYLDAGLPGDDTVLHNPKIGSSLKGKAPLSGLTIEEEKEYLPEIIGYDPTDVSWRKEVKDYWSNISERVPHDKEGTNSRLPGRLVSFTIQFDNLRDKKIFDNAETFDSKAAFSTKGKIIEGVADYVLFRYCLVYGRVANAKADRFKSGKIAFYLYSQETDAKVKYSKFELRRRAKAMFDGVLEDVSKLNALLRVFGQDPTDSFVFQSIEDKHLKLDTLIDENPKRFITFMSDKSLAQKALIKEAVLAGVVHNPTNTDSYYYGDDKQIVLGNSLSDAVLFLRSKDERNVQILESIKSQVQYANS